MTHPSIHARAHPNRIAYRMAAAAKAISYREFDELSNQGAHLFRALGLKAGDHIALLMENRLAFMEMLGRAAQRALVHRDQPLPERGRDRLYRQRLGRQGFHHPAEMRRAGQGAQHGQAWRTLVLHGRRAARRFPFLRQGSDCAAADADCGRGRRLRHAVFVGYPGRPKGIKKQFEGNRIDLANPFLKVLCANMCGMNAETTYLSPAPLYHAAPLRFNMMAIVLGGTSRAG